ncbi:hypothetical protein C8F01DRAFT_1241907 [Mycena amicta]|nr:hypothetical protein C8F01DRAFT_1241907 [Mycena amicta]
MSSKAPKPRGRPPKKFSGRAKVKQDQLAVLRASLVEPPVTPPIDGGDGEETLGGDDAREVLLSQGALNLWSPAHGFNSHFDKTATIVLPRRDWQAEGWDLRGTIDVPKWFDQQLNDYGPKRYSATTSVVIEYFGHPGDTKHDIRARRGIHDLVVEDESSVSGDDDEDQPERTREVPEEEPEEEAPQRRKRWKGCSNLVQLQLEITADDLTLVHIWQLNSHEDTSTSQQRMLQYSPLLRLQMLDACYRFGTKTTSLLKDLVRQFTQRILTPLPATSRQEQSQLQEDDGVVLGGSADARGTPHEKGLMSAGDDGLGSPCSAPVQVPIKQEAIQPRQREPCTITSNRQPSSMPEPQRDTKTSR